MSWAAALQECWKEQHSLFLQGEGLPLAACLRMLHAQAIVHSSGLVLMGNH